MVHAVTQTLGVDVTAVEDTATRAVNETVIASDGKTYRYVQAGGAIAASQTDISVTSAGVATDGSGAYVGPSTAVSNGQYFWVSGASPVV